MTTHATRRRPQSQKNVYVDPVCPARAPLPAPRTFIPGFNVLAPLLVAAILTLAGCGPTPDRPERGLSARVEAELLRAEDRRDPAPVRPILDDPEPAARARACLALGRIADPFDIELLAGRLADDEPEVREMAAFALALIGGEEAAAHLGAVLDDPAPEVRARAAAAIVRIGGAGVVEAVRPMIERRDGEAAREALLGIWRAQDPAAVPIVLAFATDDDPTLRAAAAYSLMRMLGPAGVGATPVPGGTSFAPEQRRGAAGRLAELAQDPDPRVRELAARALGGEDLPGAVDVLIGLLDDDVWRVRVNALRSLGRAGEGVDPTALVGSLSDRNPNVRLAGLRALAAVSPERGPEDRVEPFLGAAEPALRIAAAEGMAAWRGATFVPDLRAMAADEGPTIRAAAATILGEIEAPGVEQVLSDLQEDPSPRVVVAAITARAGRDGADRRALARDALASEEFTVRATGVGLLEEGDADFIETLGAAWDRARDDPQTDVRMAVTQGLEEIEDEGAALLLDRILREDPDWRVRREAAEILRRRGQSATAGPLETGRDLAYYEAVAEETERDWKVALSVDGGEIILALHAREAPLTVANFVSLVRDGYFDGTRFHRVVPNFVAQGGDPRGDGWGGPGHQIRCEINPRRYRRASVGMALAGKDTGGSQFFITHTPQPHLDGGYTLFGEVVEGMEIVDRLVQEDRILRARVVGE